ncbi:hypothetical protein JH06_5910 [Blastocystis sp. subtype 4]|uniref:hypothetical protein n=1 Tax=Blastocystis sp. subtype 4 TaxID=944170 RepID=UPI000711F96F|nr:hypothetical protein JH06_5910 [Blastocystis sp. subtype 4]KNB41259.1 hypothetical protein JH06_5910 [Blastocystis sp. subtype 4]|eukprot:XP_014524702.1 hypothetical protein JH06_5910 [Blastocystis sp. subtype 4]
MAYCKATGSVCPGIDNYPSVGEGQISPSSCPEGYRGYSYRECSNGVWIIVTNARYQASQYMFVMGTQVTTGVPLVMNIVERWYIDTGVFLPDGLSLNAQTGEISGNPIDTMDLTYFTVYAENQSGATQATLSIVVRKGRCVAEGVFPMTDVGEVAEYDCAFQGSYVKRACVLGSEDGEWQKASGFCMPIFAIVLIVIVVIVIVVIVVFLLMRVGSKAKAIGGVKGKKSSKSTKSTKTMSKKGSGKQIKV